MQFLSGTASFFVLVTLTAALQCSEPPQRDPACADQPVVVQQPQETGDDDLLDLTTGVVYRQGLFWPMHDDNTTTCACSRPVRTPIAKCCPVGFAFSEDYECVESDARFLPLVYGPGGAYYPEDFENITMLVCEDGESMIPLFAEDIAEVTAAGRLLTPLEAELVAAGRFCLESNSSEDSGGPMWGAMCFVDQRSPELSASQIAYVATTLASTPLLLATAVIYIVMPELHTLHGRCVACHASSMFSAYLLLTLTQILSEVISDEVCVTSAFIIYFSFLASFFWLNVMCFDIFWTFSGFRSLRGTAREREHKKFIIYSIYSWGCPLIMLCVTLVMQFHDNIPEGYLRPQFGVKKCWFTEDKLTTLAYFYGPVGVLVLCNIILFILTACKIAKLKRETAMLKGTDSRRHDDDNRQRFNLYLKLFLVMGVNWSMEVISWLVGGPEYVWYVTDICNTLQGVLIFVIFVWKDRIRRMLMEKFCPKRASTKLSKSTAVTYSTRASPSRLSHGMLNNKIVDNGNGEAVKIVAISPISDDSDVP